MSEEPLHHVLLYTYVDNMLERRKPHREGHLERIAEAKQTGRLIMAGALGDPPTGGALVWRGATVEEIEAFVAADPYQQAGLLTDHRIEPWTLV
jgi:uncharacterized protein